MTFAFSPRRFDDTKEIEQNAMEELMAIPKKVLQECFHKWEKQTLEGSTLEGDVHSKASTSSNSES